MELNLLSYDVVVVGSGAAGCAAAYEAAASGAKTLLLSKDPLTASDTKIAEGIVTVRGSGDPGEQVDDLKLNMRVQGDDLSDPSVVDAFASDSRSAYDWLVEQGLLSALSPETGQPDPLELPMGGHDRRRSVDHKNGALDYAHALWNSIHRTGQIDKMEDVWAIDLLVDRETENSPRLTGLLAYHAATGRFLSIAAPSVVLACGGASFLYFPCTDCMRGNTGDAYGMALRAGVSLVDMEQVQFLPFGITSPSAFEGLVAGEPVSCGPLGVLRNQQGEIILSELMGRTRAECAAAIAQAVSRGEGTENGGCWLDLTANAEGEAGPYFVDLMSDKIGSTLANIRKAMGHEAARFKAPWEVRPTAHYFMGGIEANGEGATELAGLYVAGQAMGGVHGSNRLGSTSLAEGAIFGRRAGRAASIYAGTNAIETHNAEQLAHQLLQGLSPKWGDRHCQTGTPPVLASSIQARLQSLAFDSIGPARNQQQMQAFLKQVEGLSDELEQASCAGPKVWNQALLDYLDTRNLIASARLVGSSALARTHSVGAHVRVDSEVGEIKKSQSIRVRAQDGVLSIIGVQRPGSPTWSRRLFLTRERLQRSQLWVLNRLPIRLRDRILIKRYQQITSPTA